MAVPYIELEGSPTERITQDGMEATRVFEVDWDRRWDFCSELLGTTRFAASRQRQHYPGNPNLVVDEISEIIPWPGDTPSGASSVPDRSLPRHPRARITVVYRTVKSAPPGGIDWGGGQLPPYPVGTFLEYSGSVENQVLVLPGRTFRWVDSPNLPVAEDINAGIRVPVIQHQLVWSRVISPPIDAIVNCIGCVNHTTFLGAPAGTLLFSDVNWDITYDLLPDVPPRWRLTYAFSQRVIRQGSSYRGWNHFYREQAPAGWWRLAQTNGDDPFPSRDFNQLFQFRVLGEFTQI